MASITHTVTGITVASITAADPGVLTATAHGYTTGDVVLHEAMDEMTELNDQLFDILEIAGDNSYNIRSAFGDGSNLSTAAFTAETTGGTSSLGLSPVLTVPVEGEEVSVTLTGTWVATIALEREIGYHSNAWVEVKRWTANTVYTFATKSANERYRMRTITWTSGTITAVLADSAKPEEAFLHDDGTTWLEVTQDAATFQEDLSVLGDLAVTGATTLTGTLDVVTLDVEVIEAGDASLGINGIDAAQGGAILATGGTSSTGGNAGGAVGFVGGTPGSTGIGGAVNHTGGVGGSSSGTGGGVTTTGGAGTAGNAAGGSAQLTGGAGEGSAAGGTGVVTGGAGGATGIGGSVTILGGLGGGTSGAGGAANITGGDAQDGDTAGGACVITGGASTGSGEGGDVNLVGGVGNESGSFGGDINLTGGAGFVSGGGGDLILTAGRAGSTGTTGLITITGGQGGSTSGDGGAVSITGGAAANNDDDGGAVTIAGGAPNGTGATGLVTIAGIPGPELQAADPSQKVTLMDDFFEFNTTLWSDGEGSDAQALGPSIVADDLNGSITFRSGDADNAAGSFDVSGTCGNGLIWQTDSGGLAMEARIKIDDITSASFFVGFTDLVLADGAMEAPIEASGSGDVITAEAGDAAGIIFDTDFATSGAFINLGSVNATVVTTVVVSATSPTNDTYVTLRVTLTAAGILEGFIDGVSIGTIASAITIADPVCPAVLVRGRTTAVRNLTVDYIWVQQNR